MLILIFISLISIFIIIFILEFKFINIKNNIYLAYSNIKTKLLVIIPFISLIYSIIRILKYIYIKKIFIIEQISN